MEITDIRLNVYAFLDLPNIDHTYTGTLEICVNTQRDGDDHVVCCKKMGNLKENKIHLCVVIVNTFKFDIFCVHMNFTRDPDQGRPDFKSCEYKHNYYKEDELRNIFKIQQSTMNAPEVSIAYTITFGEVFDPNNFEEEMHQVIC